MNNVSLEQDPLSNINADLLYKQNNTQLPSPTRRTNLLTCKPANVQVSLNDYIRRNEHKSCSEINEYSNATVRSATPYHLSRSQ